MDFLSVVRSQVGKKFDEMRGGSAPKDPFNDQYFIDYITNTKTLTEPSKAIYLRQIKRVTTEFWGKPVTVWWVISHPDLFAQALRKWGLAHKGRNGSQGTSQATLSQFMRIMTSLLTSQQELRENYQDLIKRWKIIKSQFNEPLEDKTLSGAKSKRQSEGFISYSELCRVRDELPDGSLGKILIGLYTWIEPLRSNFDQVRIYETAPKEVAQDENYIVLRTSEMTIQKFKTMKSYDPIIVKIPKVLMEQINASLEMDPREYLFVNRKGELYTPSSWNIWANSTLRNILNNKNFSLTLFRHAYVTRDEVKTASIPERRRIAKQMGHSTVTNINYEFE